MVPDAPWVIDPAFLEKYNIDYVAHDDEPYLSAGHDDVYALVKSLGLSHSPVSFCGPSHMSPGKFIPTRRTPGISTSSILERIVKGYRNNDFDKKLEKMGCGELMAQGSHYVNKVEQDDVGQDEQRSR